MLTCDWLSVLTSPNKDSLYISMHVKLVVEYSFPFPAVQNRSRNARVIVKDEVTCFNGSRCIIVAII